MAKKVYRAGLIPYYKNGSNEIEMMFMMPDDPHSRWGGEVYQIAKGKVDEGEQPEETAVREAQEELGLFRPNIDGKLNLLGRFLGRTDVYVARIKDKNMFGDTCFETKSTTWMTKEEFLKEGRELHRPIIKAAFRLIERKEKQNG